jgi:transcriptional regulator with XRE-family HTH domain
LTFGEHIRRRREAHGIGLTELAQRLGVSPAYWSRIERDQEKPPRDDLIERAAAILEIRLDDLFVDAGRLPPDMRSDLRAVVQHWRRRDKKKIR